VGRVGDPEQAPRAVHLPLQGRPGDRAAADRLAGDRGRPGSCNSTVGTFAVLKPEEFDLIMAVNVYGPHRVERLAGQDGRNAVPPAIAENL